MILDIQFVKEGSTTDLSYSPNLTRASINGILDKHSVWHKEQKELKLVDQRVIDELYKYPLTSIFQFVSSLNFPLRPNLEDFLFQFTVEYVLPLNQTTLRFLLYTSLEDWDQPFSVREFRIALVKFLVAHDSSLKPENFDANYGGSHYLEIDSKNEVKDWAEKVSSIKKLYSEGVRYVYHELTKNYEEQALVTIFNFPESTKVPCKQYLIYFAQFLNDLGIEAETELKEGTTGTIFKVIPKDSNQALENIRDALNIYLNVPAAPNFSSEISNNNVAVMQWQSNVMQLQSQMLLMQSVVQAKEATIQAQEATIQSLQLSKYLIENITVDIDNEKTKSEDILPGIVSVGKLQWQGIEVDLAEILRRLKRSLL